jgi:hypothetical protein
MFFRVPRLKSENNLLAVFSHWANVTYESRKNKKKNTRMCLASYMSVYVYIYIYIYIRPRVYIHAYMGLWCPLSKSENSAIVSCRDTLANAIRQFPSLENIGNIPCCLRGDPPLTLHPFN